MALYEDLGENLQICLIILPMNMFVIWMYMWLIFRQAHLAASSTHEVWIHTKPVTPDGDFGHAHGGDFYWHQNKPVNTIPGWWFGTCFSIYIYIYIGNFHILGIIIPTDEVIFFRGVEITNRIPNGYQTPVDGCSTSYSDGNNMK